MTNRIPDIAWPLLIITIVLAYVGQPVVSVPEFKVTPDKIAHFAVFGALATSIVRLPRVQRLGWKGAAIACVLTMLFGAFDEVRQSYSPDRSMEFADWIADTLGAMVAVTVYQGWPWYRHLLEKRVA